MRSANPRRMKNRRSFLASVAAATAGVALSAREAGAQSPASPSPSAAPSARAAVAPSAGALAAAAAMRAFDPKLTETEVTAIAHGIDENRKAGAALNGKKRRLRNGDEPVTRFAAAEPIA